MCSEEYTRLYHNCWGKKKWMCVFLSQILHGFRSRSLTEVSRPHHSLMEDHGFSTDYINSCKFFLCLQVSVLFEAPVVLTSQLRSTEYNSVQQHRHQGQKPTEKWGQTYDQVSFENWLQLYLDVAKISKFQRKAWISEIIKSDIALLIHCPFLDP